MRCRAVVATIAAAVLSIGTSAVDTPADATPALARPGANLLLNPGAEVGTCTTSGYDGMTVPGWTVISGAPDSVCYGTVGFPRASAPGPADAGRSFFAGGATGDAIMTQHIALGSAADEIDGADATYDLSGWLGGFAGQDDRVGATAEFADRLGHVLDTAVLPVVTNTDRHLATALLYRDATGAIPVGARSVTITLSFTWTAGDTTDGYADNLAFRLSAAVPRPVLRVPKADVVPAFDHVFFVFMENENYSNGEAPANHDDYIVDNPQAPYLNGVLAFNGSLLSQMYATTHPSDPNYLAVTGGSTFGFARNPIVANEADMIHATNLGDELEAAGKTWKAYAEGMSYNCDPTSHNTVAGGYYLPDDEPFMLYADVIDSQKRCEAHNQPLSQLGIDLGAKGTTPNFVWFAANDANDMEDGGVKAGDDWLRQLLPEILSSPAWTTQRSLLVISWDEGHTKAFGPDYPNHIPTYVMASQGLVKDDYVSKMRYTDYSLGATIEDALGIGPMTSNDKYAQPLSDIWTSTGTGGGSPPGSQASYLTATRPSARLAWRVSTCSTSEISTFFTESRSRASQNTIGTSGSRSSAVRTANSANF